MGILTEDDVARLGQRLGQTPEQQSNQTYFDYWSGFANSAVQSPLELFGVEPGPEAVAYRQNNPLGGLGSELLGIGGAYGAWYKASKLIKPLEALIAGTDAAFASRPFVGGAVREAIRYAPFETAGIVSTAAINPSQLEERTIESVINLGAGSLIGGFSRSAKAAGLDTEPFTSLPGVNWNSKVPTLQLRELREAMDAGAYTSPADLEKFQRASAVLENAVLTEFPFQGNDYVNIPGAGKKTKNAWLDSMFHPGTRQDTTVYNATAMSVGYDTSLATSKQVLKDYLGPRSLEHIQYPRILVAKELEKGEHLRLDGDWAPEAQAFEVDSLGNAVGKPARAAPTTKLEMGFRKHMTPGGEDLYWTQERGNGLYIIAKKIPRRVEPILENPKAGKALSTEGPAAAKDVRGEDRWLLFKTDRPDLFNPSANNWRKAALSAFEPLQDLPYLPGSAGDAGLDYLKAEPIFTELAAAGPRKRENAIAAMLNKPGQTQAGMSFRRQLARWFRTYMGPGAHAFKDSPVAEMVWAGLQHMKGTSDELVSLLQRGKYQVGDNPAATLLHSKGFHGAVQGTGLSGVRSAEDILASGLKSPEDLFQWQLILKNEEDLMTVQTRWMAGEVSDAVYNMARDLSGLEARLLSYVNNAREVAGLSPLEPKPGHYAMSRRWKGDTRIAVKDEENVVRYVIGGNNRAEAQAVQKEMAKRVPQGWTFGPPALRGDSPALFEAMEVVPNIDHPKSRLALRLAENVIGPATMKERTGVGGFIGSHTEATRKELRDGLNAHISEMMQHAFELSASKVFERQFALLAHDDPFMLAQLNERYATMLGKGGGMSQALNKITDEVLGQVVGKNSATKIANAINNGLFNLTLGMGNLQHPALSMIGAFQTMLPHVALIGKAPEGVLKHFYDSHLIADSAGRVRGAVGAMSMFKMTGRALKAMGKPDAIHRRVFAKAADQGKLFPQMEQGMIGHDSIMARGIRGAAEADGLVGVIKYASEFLPRKAEEQARLISLSMGVEAAQHVLGLVEPELIERFALRFMDNTMYNFMPYARPKMFQGPVGSVFGLFKNWTMNYLFQLMDYAGLATKGEFAPLLWSLATTGAVAGVGGTALYGITEPFLQMAYGKGGLELIHEMFDPEEQWAADAIYHGLPGLLGYTLQASAAMPGADPARDASMLYSVVALDRAVALGKALGSGWDTLLGTGENPAANPQFRSELIKGLAPRSMMRWMQVSGDNYVNSLSTGQPVAKLKPMERVMWHLGFTPTQVADNYEVANRLFRDKELQSKALESFAKQWMEAQQNGDFDAVTAVTKKAIASGIPIDRLHKSVQARRKRQAQTLVQSRLPKGTRMQWLEAE